MKSEYLWITGAVIVGLIIYFMFVKKALKISDYEASYESI